MLVPSMIMLDAYIEQEDPKYEAYKFKKRQRIIMTSVFVSFVFGVAPLLGWSKMDLEPSGVSCSVFETKPGAKYISYIICCLICFEILPFGQIIWCGIKIKNFRLLKRVIRVIF